MLSLLGLTLATANPVTLNRQQILTSDFVVQGRFDPKSRSFKVEKSFPVKILQEQLKFANHNELHVNPDEEYLVPVVSMDRRYYVTPSLMKNLPLVYPAGPESETQLEKLLAEKPLR
ncbi:MAG: hypothetical protein HON04_01510 [Planctomicrobium sp.]|nr:hypothetical protein [Planctomicrobium sp.]